MDLLCFDLMLLIDLICCGEQLAASPVRAGLTVELLIMIVPIEGHAFDGSISGGLRYRYMYMSSSIDDIRHDMTLTGRHWIGCHRHGLSAAQIAGRYSHVPARSSAHATSTATGRERGEERGEGAVYLDETTP